MEKDTPHHQNCTISASETSSQADCWFACLSPPSPGGNTVTAVGEI